MSEFNRTDQKQKTAIMGIGIAVLIVIAAVVGWRMFSRPEPQPGPSSVAGPVPVPVPAGDQPVISLDATQQDADAREKMADRKAEYGMEEGVDIIARSDERVQIGDTTISMKEIEEKIRLERGDILETDLSGQESRKPTVFGIYVVQPGDNIWNIHFRFLKDYYTNRGIAVTPMADEPDTEGFSSGVGKLLKFSENMVYIYNIKERKLDVDLDLIYPLSKVVVYNMDRIFALLDSIDYGTVSRIRFDGETIWVPAEG